MKSKTLFYVGCVITFLNVLAVINGMYFFLGMAEFTVVEWLFFNICAPSTMIFIAGFILRKIWLMATAVPLLLFYGVGGLFIFGWSGTALFTQAGHLLMVSAIFYTVTVIWFEKKSIRPALAGFAGGIVLLAIVFPIQRSFVSNRMELVEEIQDPVYEEFIRKQAD